MLSIIDGGSLARALHTALDPCLKRLLVERRDQLGGNIDGQAHFLVVQADDSQDAIDRALGFSPFQNPVDGSCFGEPDFTPGWEWVADHGFCFEAVFVYEDSGFGHVLLVEKQPGVDARLIALCEGYASAHA